MNSYITGDDVFIKCLRQISVLAPKRELLVFAPKSVKNEHEAPLLVSSTIHRIRSLAQLRRLQSAKNYLTVISLYGLGAQRDAGPW